MKNIFNNKSPAADLRRGIVRENMIGERTALSRVHQVMDAR